MLVVTATGLTGHPGNCFNNYNSFLPMFPQTTGLSLRPATDEQQTSGQGMASMMVESPVSTVASSSSYDPDNSPQGYRGERGYRAAPPVTRNSNRTIAARAYNASEMNPHPTGQNSLSPPSSSVQPPVTPDRNVNTFATMAYYPRATPNDLSPEAQFYEARSQAKVQGLLSPFQLANRTRSRALDDSPDEDMDMDVSPTRGSRVE
jgi:hypothetical protein